MFSRHMFSRTDVSDYKITYRQIARASVHKFVTSIAVGLL